MCRSCCYQEDIGIPHQCQGSCSCSGPHGLLYPSTLHGKSIITVDVRWRKEL